MLVDSVIATQDIRLNFVYNMEGFDTLTITQTGAILWREDSAITCSAGELFNNVNVFGLISIGNIHIGDASTITIAASGSISLLRPASDFVIGNVYGTTSLYNAGSIFSMTTGVATQGAQNFITNSGVIFGSQYGVALGTDASYQDALFNSGTITGHRYAGVSVEGNSQSVTNTGTIESELNVALQIFGPMTNTTVVAEQRILNSGVISSPSDWAIYAATNAVSTVNLNNSGIVQGSLFSFRGGAEHDLIINTGTMTGTVDLGDGSDSFDGSYGRVTGSVVLGAGADTFKGFGAVITGTVNGGSGSDLYYTDQARLSIVEAGSDIDTVYAAVSFRLSTSLENLTLLEGGDFRAFGNVLANVMNGNSGDNRLTGLDGNDTINGDLGADRLLGGIANDSLTGDDGDDTVLGQAGADTVRGGDGDDVLNGGAGKDLYVGNDGADSFTFTATAHSATGQTTADVISDFINGDDLINVLTIDANRNNTQANDTFSFIGTNLFSPVTPGQLRYYQSGGNTYVEMEVNGDGVADSGIKLSGLVTLTFADFVL